MTIPAPGQTLAWTSADTYEHNRLPFTTTVNDNVYMPLAGPEEVEAGTEVTNTLIYDTDIEGRFIFRLSGFKPFTSDQTIPDSGRTVAAVRTVDNVVT